MEQDPAAMQELGGANQPIFETVVRSQLGPSQFMRFHAGLFAGIETH